MKKLIIGIIFAAILSTPSMSLIARHGRGGAAAAGFIGGALVGTAISGSGRGAKREAREAKRDVEEIRREQQQEKLYEIRRQMARQYMEQRSSRTINILIFAIVLLFLGFVILAAIVLKKK